MVVKIKEEYRHLYTIEGGRVFGKEKESLVIRKNFKYYFIDLNHVE